MLDPSKRVHPQEDEPEQLTTYKRVRELVTAKRSTMKHLHALGVSPSLSWHYNRAWHTVAPGVEQATSAEIGHGKIECESAFLLRIAFTGYTINPQQTRMHNS